MKLTDFSVLSFDCYGTLIDWESGIHTALQPLLRAAPMAREAALSLFGRLEAAEEAATPGLIYPEILARVHRRFAAELGLASSAGQDQAFGASVADWPAFPDSAGALRYLGQHYRLVILSNVDRASFRASNARLGVTFDQVHTAEDIGSYKPDPANFRYLLARLAEAGHRPAQLLHTAQSLFHDHAPAQALGLASAWIDRRAGRAGAGATPPATARHDFRFPSLAAMADAHRAELASPGAR